MIRTSFSWPEPEAFINACVLLIEMIARVRCESIRVACAAARVKAELSHAFARRPLPPMCAVVMCNCGSSSDEAYQQIEPAHMQVCSCLVPAK